MSKKLTSEENHGEISWEEAVSRYLQDHPDYFQSHPHLLTDLALNHEVGGGAVSLIEHQVKTLRGQNHESQRQLRELVGVGRENDVLGLRLHRFALALIGCATLDDTLDTAYEMLRQEFKLDAAAILFRGDPAKAGHRRECVAADDKRLAELLRLFTSGTPICGGRHDESLLKYLFGVRAGEIKSSALIPLGEGAPQGALGLGSVDPHRFHPGMGTVYLTRLGELLARGLRAHLA